MINRILDSLMGHVRDVQLKNREGNIAGDYRYETFEELKAQEVRKLKELHPTYNDKQIDLLLDTNKLENSAERATLSKFNSGRVNDKVLFRNQVINERWEVGTNRFKEFFGFGREGRFSLNKRDYKIAYQGRLADAQAQWKTITDPVELADAQRNFAKGEFQHWMKNKPTGRFLSAAGNLAGNVASGGLALGALGFNKLTSSGAFFGGLGTAIGQTAISTISTAETGARLLLTGGVKGVGSGLEGWMPGFNKFAASDVRKYTLNPKIPGRILGMSTVAAVGAGFTQALNIQPTQTSLILEAGGRIRHANDLGANSTHGQNMMSLSNSLRSLNNPATRMAIADAII